MPELLSEQWFGEVERLAERYGNIPLSDKARDTLINISVGTDAGDVALRMEGGQFKRGHSPEAKTAVTLPIREFMTVFVENDPKAGMEAFMQKKMKVEGDMAPLMDLQWIEMTGEQRAMQAELAGLSELPTP